jgi:hypothetical protein
MLGGFDRTRGQRFLFLLDVARPQTQEEESANLGRDIQVLAFKQASRLISSSEGRACCLRSLSDVESLYDHLGLTVAHYTRKNTSYSYEVHKLKRNFQLLIKFLCEVELSRKIGTKEVRDLRGNLPYRINDECLRSQAFEMELFASGLHGDTEKGASWLARWILFKIEQKNVNLVVGSKDPVANLLSAEGYRRLTRERLQEDERICRALDALHIFLFTGSNEDVLDHLVSS